MVHNEWWVPPEKYVPLLSPLADGPEMHFVRLLGRSWRTLHGHTEQWLYIVCPTFSVALFLSLTPAPLGHFPQKPLAYTLHTCVRVCEHTHTCTHTPGIGRVWNHKRCLGGGKGEDGKVSLIGIMRAEIKLRYIKTEWMQAKRSTVI